MAKKTTKKKKRSDPVVPQEPLERLFPWAEDARVVRNPELYLELRRAGVVARPSPDLGDDREWRHTGKHWDFCFHADEWNHLDENRHGDEAKKHLDDKPDGV